MVHIATDWVDYAEHIMDTLESHPHFQNRAGDHMYSERPEYRPLTKFENRGQAWLNNTGWRLDYQMVSANLARAARSCQIYKDERFSDHSPLTIDYQI